MPRARKNNKPATPNGNSLALDQILAKESAKRTLKTVKKQKVKCMFWLEDITLKSKYEFSSKERFESTIKRLIKDAQNKRLRASHPRLLNAVRRGQSITENVA